MAYVLPSLSALEFQISQSTATGHPRQRGDGLMRVLILNYEYPPLGGGAGVATAQLARHLAERGTAVDVVTAGVSTTPASLLGVEGEGGLSLYRVRSRRAPIRTSAAAPNAS